MRSGRGDATLSRVPAQQPWISYHKVYRFVVNGLPDGPITGIVTKAEPYRVMWEARLEESGHVGHSDTRAGAVTAALALVPEGRAALDNLVEWQRR